MKHNLSVVLGAFLLALALFGCGGGGSAPQTGRATVSVTWPAASTRLIPFASSSIRVLVTQGTQGVGEAILARPASGGTASATFDRLPTGSVTVTATAYPDPNAAGVAQAAGSAPVTIVKGQVASLNLTLASTITEATVSPVAASVAVGGDTKLAVSFRNAQSQVVLVALATTQWTSRTPGVATVDAAGRVVGVAAGTAVIEAKDTESGKVGLAEVTVTGSGGGGGGGSGSATYNPANGHYYEAVVVSNGISWTNAKAAAEARGGYLATLTSAAENDFVFGLIDSATFWTLGGSPQSSFGPWLGGEFKSGVWQWVTGEPWSYTNWHSGQPDRASGVEDKLMFWVRTANVRQSTWNDVINYDNPPGRPITYVIEWNTNPGGGGTGSTSDDPTSGLQPPPYSGTANPNAPTFSAPASYSTVSAPQNILVADLDGDGNQDVIVGGSNGVAVLFGRGDGTLTASQQVFTKVDGGYPQAIADMNGDGRLDIVAPDNLDKVHVIPNLGNRQFGDSLVTTVGWRVRYLTAGDFNQDGKRDIAVSGYDSANITFYAGTGTGALTKGVSFNVSGWVGGLASGDLDADGKLDIAAAFNTSIVDTSGWQVVRGNGNGTFTQGATYQTATQSVLYPLIADFNRDGRWDVALSNFHASHTSVSLNNGAGTFALRTTYSFPGNPHSGAVADLNRDGYPDIIEPLAGQRKFFVLRNKGNGQLADRVEYDALGNNTIFLTTADLNKDGKPDVICSGRDSNIVTVSLNTTP